jgi:carboxylate-amine ligase
MAELTLGVEEEYQIIDPTTGHLTSRISDFLEKSDMKFPDQIKPEFMQSQVEVGSNVCRDVTEVRSELVRLRSMVRDIAEEFGCRIIAAATHPFSSWQEQLVTEGERYKMLIDHMQIIAKRLLIFGMHIHVGIEDPEMRIDIMNQMRYFMPHILALSTSSPFWMGENTGLKSYRSVIFEDLPRTGTPEHFNSASEFDLYIDTLIRTGCIDEPTKIWWDIRPHPKFPTLEFRICDCMTRVDDVVAVVALVQSLVAKLIKLRRKNQTWRVYRTGLINENKWRALRHGIHGKLIDLGQKREVEFKTLVEEMLDFVDDVVDEVGTREALARIPLILAEGTSADRQLKTFEETGSLEAVIKMLADDTVLGF